MFTAEITSSGAMFHKNCRLRLTDSLERFQKYCSHAGKGDPERSFWVLASFWLSYRVALNLRLRQSLAKAQKSALRVGYSISSNALIAIKREVFKIAKFSELYKEQAR